MVEAEVRRQPDLQPGCPKRLSTSVVGDGRAAHGCALPSRLVTHDASKGGTTATFH
jgi:hypothetical protein